MTAMEREAMLCLTQPQAVIAMLRQQRDDLQAKVERLETTLKELDQLLPTPAATYMELNLRAKIHEAAQAGEEKHE